MRRSISDIGEMVDLLHTSKILYLSESPQYRGVEPPPWDMAKKRQSNKTRYRLAAPANLSTSRLFIGELFGSIKHWWKVLLAVGIVIVAWRANAEDLPPIAESIVKAFEKSGAVAWVITVCVVLSSIAVIRFIIWRDGKELDRIKGERDKCQERLIQRKMRSSS